MLVNTHNVSWQTQRRNNVALKREQMIVGFSKIRGKVLVVIK